MRAMSLFALHIRLGVVFVSGVLIMGVWGCATPGVQEPALFRLLPEAESGVRFTNEVPEDSVFSILNYLYYYDGGGIAAGDVNNDGLVDLYFTATKGANALYLNEGNLKFADVTEQAGVAGDADWTKGVTMADVNGDGWLDIYVSSVQYKSLQGRNALYINNGDGTFTDQAEAYGLDLAGLSTQAAFFDYDLDGDLDVYLVRHSVHDIGQIGGIDMRNEGHPTAGDKLMRNDGGRFMDVTEEAGLYSSALGYGLAVAVSDLNHDGCPDLYVSNDFHENDYLYFNTCNGTFREAIYEAMGHTSRSAMGNDVGDINNDGWPDIIVTDMLPDRDDILKTASGDEGYDVYRIKVNRGYHHQFARNTLQLNLGNERFKDIGYHAGIYATDWSWASLFADFDNDGFNDLFITNGIVHRPNDLDYLAHVRSPAMQVAMRRDSISTSQGLLDRMPSVPIPNYLYRNNGDLTFTNQAAAWGVDQAGFSNGAAYADLDNDGDLDLVVNNINTPSAVYENRSTAQADNRYLMVELEGEGLNTDGIGAKVWAFHGATIYYREQSPSRGWQSSVDPRLHIGLGAVASLDSLRVVWPNGQAQTLPSVATNQALTLRQAEATERYRYPSTAPETPLFEDRTDEVGLGVPHEENAFIDFSREPLMPHMLSQEGPALAVGDVNGDELDDVFIGGAKWQAAQLLVQQTDGRFLATNTALWAADSLYEDADAVFFDADRDGDVDLYVASAGNEFWGRNNALRDRLYLNDGQGRLTRDEAALPEVFNNTSVVRPHDIDQDGDLDLFVGSRVITRAYGEIPPSYILQNDGHGRFTDVTATVAPALAEAGLVSDAVWTDTNSDGTLDLVLVGEWMPIRILAATNGQLVEQTEAAGLSATQGWWNTVVAIDIDNDGDADLMAGNLGTNSYFKTSSEDPVRMYVTDADGNGRVDQVLTHVRNGSRTVYASRDELIQQISGLANTFPTYAAFGASTLDDIIPPVLRDEAQVWEARTFETMAFINQGDGTFAPRTLPLAAQFAPVYAIHAADMNADGYLDVLLGGNFDGVLPRRGRYDASYGVLLLGDGAGGFMEQANRDVNLWLSGDVRVFRTMQRADGTRFILAARNDSAVQLLQPLR